MHRFRYSIRPRIARGLSGSYKNPAGLSAEDMNDALYDIIEEMEGGGDA